MNYYWSYPDCKIIIRYSKTSVTGLISTKGEMRDIPKAQLFHEDEKDQVKELCFEAYGVMTDMGVSLDTRRLLCADCFDPEWVFIEGEDIDAVWARVLEGEGALDRVMSEVVEIPAKAEPIIQAVEPHGEMSESIPVKTVEPHGQMLLF